MPARLMGMETEYAVSGRTETGGAHPVSLLAVRLLDQASQDLVNLSACGNNGLFLANASRLYVDSGAHPELSTPECLTPWDVARFVEAGDRLVLQLATTLRERIGGRSRIDVFKTNVDYSGSGATWGCHESYLHRIPGSDFHYGLLPHLVTRIVYTGAGGFDTRIPGLSFTVSPRVDHLTTDVSGSSTSSRGIVHSKNEDLSRGTYGRLHLLCGESLKSQTGTVLKVGTTALVLALLERGVLAPRQVALHEPLAAMRTLAHDPSCRIQVPVQGGEQMSAIDIQKSYLHLVEDNLGAGWLPDWSERICILWRQVLQKLADDPTALCGTLDWAIKHPLVSKQVRDRGFDDQRIERMNRFLMRLRRRLRGVDLPDNAVKSSSLVQIDTQRGRVADIVDTALQADRLDREELAAFQSLRRDLYVFDMKFGQLGDTSVFSALAAAGALNHELLTEAEITQATEFPPEGTRATLRGRAVRRLADKPGEHTCYWDGVHDDNAKKWLDLANPFARKESWVARAKTHRRRRRLGQEPPDFLELLARYNL